MSSCVSFGLIVASVAVTVFFFFEWKYSSDTRVSGAWIFEADSSWKDVRDPEAEFPASFGGV